MIWNRWTTESLPQCNVHSQWFKSARRELNVGDLVCIVDESVKSTFYQMARVLEKQTGSDGIVRSSKIKSESGELQRPLTKLAPVFTNVFRVKTGPARLARPLKLQLQHLVREIWLTARKSFGRGIEPTVFPESSMRGSYEKP